LGFLGPSSFAVSFPVSGCLISLDFLGFSRPNRDLSMRYAGFSLKDFSLQLRPWRS
jgi:hypothetical protein